MQTSFSKITEILKGYSLPPFNLVIKRFGSDFEEQLDNFTNESELFPILWVNPPSGNTIGRNVNTYTFDIIVLDQIMEGRENVNTIVSDCHLILIDFYKWVVESTTLDIDIIQEPNAYSVNNSQLDGLAGARMTVSIEVDSIGVCQIPILENVTPIPLDPICEDATYLVRYESGEEIESGSIPSGGNAEIIVPNPDECEDATALLKDSDGLLISTTAIGSGLVGNITAPNSNYEVKYQNGTLIESGVIVSNGSKSIIVPNPIICSDSTAVLRDEDGNIISSTDLVSGTTEDIVAPSGTVTAKNSLASTIGSTTVLSNGTANIPISDSAITLNDLAFLSVPAENSKNIILVDQNDAPIIPDSVIGNEIKVNVPSLYLPSGIYTPKNLVSGPFDLLWENQTSGIVTGDGSIERIDGGYGWNKSAVAHVDHKGDFELNFKLPTIGKFFLFGASFFKETNSYERIGFSFYRTDTNLINVFYLEAHLTSGVPTLPTDTLTIARYGNNMVAKQNGAVLFTKAFINIATPFFIDNSILHDSMANDIQVIIP